MPTYRVQAPAIYVEAEDIAGAVEIAIEHWDDMPYADFDIEDQTN